MDTATRRTWACLLVALLAACNEDAPNQHPNPASSPDSTSRGEDPRNPGPIVVFLGDSLTAGLHLPAEEAFPDRVGALLGAEGSPIEVRNAGVSGDTSAGGARRIEWLLTQEPDLLVLELGANDGLRGTPVEDTEANLRAILDACADAGVPVLLLGMRLPPNYGPDYITEFEAIYPRLAQDYGLPFMPFLLEPIADQPDLFLEDMLHPNAEGHQAVADALLPHLQKALEELTESSPRR